MDKEIIEFKEIVNRCLILSDIWDEYKEANSEFHNFNSYHEGIATIREEFEELWDEVKKKNPDKEKLRKECIQIGAMVIKFIIDLIDVDKVMDGRRR
jgi:hypothetical protein